MAGAIVGPVIQGAMGTVGTIFNSIAGIKADKKLKSLLETDPEYTISPYAKNTLGLATTLLNARMPGAAFQERNIYGTGANALNNINNNATDASQAITAGAGVLGKQDEQFGQLGMQDAQDYYNRLGNLNKANEGMTAEHQAQFDDQVRRWQDQVNTVMTQYKMRRQGGNDWSQLGAAGASLGSGMGK